MELNSSRRVLSIKERRNFSNGGDYEIPECVRKGEIPLIDKKKQAGGSEGRISQRER